MVYDQFGVISIGGNQQNQMDLTTAEESMLRPIYSFCHLWHLIIFFEIWISWAFLGKCISMLDLLVSGLSGHKSNPYTAFQRPWTSVFLYRSMTHAI